MTLNDLITFAITSERYALLPDDCLSGCEADVEGHMCVWTHQGDDFVTLIFSSGIVVKIFPESIYPKSAQIHQVDGTLDTLLYTPIRSFTSHTYHKNGVAWCKHTFETDTDTVCITWRGEASDLYGDDFVVFVVVPENPYSAHHQTALIKEAQT